jgi:hypothetical protein
LRPRRKPSKSPKRQFSHQSRLDQSRGQLECAAVLPLLLQLQFLSKRRSQSRSSSSSPNRSLSKFRSQNRKPSSETRADANLMIDRGSQKCTYSDDYSVFRYNDSCQIFVGALPRNMTEEDIKGVFEEFGEVQHIRINQGNRADSKNGFGFVTFKSEESVKNALEKKVSLLFSLQCILLASAICLQKTG